MEARWIWLSGVWFLLKRSEECRISKNHYLIEITNAVCYMLCLFLAIHHSDFISIVCFTESRNKVDIIPHFVSLSAFFAFNCTITNSKWIIYNVHIIIYC